MSRLVFRTALESTGVELAAAEDGEAALSWLKENRVDLVLLDLQMPRDRRHGASSGG